MLPALYISLWKPSHCWLLVLQSSVTVVGWSLRAVTSWCQNYSSGAPDCPIWESQILQNVKSVKSGYQGIDRFRGRLFHSGGVHGF